MTLDEILKLAETFEAQAALESATEPSLKDNMEQAKKHAEVKLMLNQVKKLCDMIDVKYKSSGKSSGLFKIFDSNYHNTLGGIRRSKRELEDILINLDKKF